MVIATLLNLTFILTLPANDSSAAFKRYFGEIESITRQIVNPETSEGSRRILVHQLTSEIEISKELSALAARVQNDISLPTLDSSSGVDKVDATWKKLSLRVLKTYSPDELASLILRLKHKDSAVQSMALMSLDRRLRESMPLSLGRSKIETYPLEYNELSELFQQLYEKSRAVEPAFLSGIKTKNADRDIAAEISRQLRQTLANQ